MLRFQGPKSAVRITECSGLEGTSVDHLAQPSCQSRVTYSRLHRNLSTRVLNISRKGDSTTSLGSLFQCSVTLRGKKFFLMFSWKFLCFSLCPLIDPNAPHMAELQSALLACGFLTGSLVDPKWDPGEPTKMGLMTHLTPLD